MLADCMLTRISVRMLWFHQDGADHVISSKGYGNYCFIQEELRRCPRERCEARDQDTEKCRGRLGGEPGRRRRQGQDHRVPGTVEGDLRAGRVDPRALPL